MIKTVNGKKYIQWGRVVMALIMVSIISTAIVLSFLNPDKLKAFTEFCSSPGFVTVTGLLGTSIGVNSVVRSIVKKPGVTNNGNDSNGN